MITIANLNKIDIELTTEEKNRMKTYTEQNIQKKDPAKHDYINESIFKFMYRCPIVTCKYNIINPHNPQQSIIEHCKHFHYLNKILYQYNEKYSRAMIQVLYDKQTLSPENTEIQPNEKPIQEQPKNIPESSNDQKKT